MLTKAGFDKWSKEYDHDVRECYINKEYPFDGYFDVFDIILNKIKGKSKVLDVGFGTGILTKKIYDLNCIVYGIDFSFQMVSISKEKMPNANFYQADFNDELPTEIKKEKFDYIISTYALHHLEDNKKVEFISKLSTMLNQAGKIIIGDISFATTKEQDICKEKAGNGWDSDEYYITADSFTKKLENLGLKVNYKQISSCSGILIIEKNKL